MRQQLGIAWRVGEVFEAAVKSREAEALALSAENRQLEGTHADEQPAAALKVPPIQELLANQRRDLDIQLRSNGSLPVLQRLAAEEEIPGNGAHVPGTDAHWTAGTVEGRGGNSELPLLPAVEERARAKTEPSLAKSTCQGSRKTGNGVPGNGAHMSACGSQSTAGAGEGTTEESLGPSSPAEAAPTTFCQSTGEDRTCMCHLFHMQHWRRRTGKGIPGNGPHMSASSSQTTAGTEEGTAGESLELSTPAEAAPMTSWQQFMLERFTEEDGTNSNEAEAPAGDLSSTAGTSEVPAGTVSNGVALPAGGKGGAPKRTRRGGRRKKARRGQGGPGMSERVILEGVGPRPSAMDVAAAAVAGESNGGQHFVEEEEMERVVDREGEEGRALESENEESAGEAFGSVCSSLSDEWFDAEKDTASVMEDGGLRDSRQNSLTTGL